MAYEDEIIKLRAASYASLADGGAVDAGIGLNFDIVLQDGGAGLAHFVPRPVFLLGKTEAVTADDRSILQDHAMAEAARFTDDGVGVREEIVANVSAAIDGDETVKNGVAADFGFFIYETVGADVRSFADAGGLCNHGSCMNARRIARSLIEKLDGMGESEIWI
jgi:hypothetical protein